MRNLTEIKKNNNNNNNNNKLFLGGLSGLKGCLVIFRSMNVLFFFSSCSILLLLAILLPRSCNVELTFNHCSETIVHACSYLPCSSSLVR